MASTNSLPQGFIPVMLTPFTDNGAIDYAGLSVLTDYYMQAGSAGLFANCLSSEMYELSNEERVAITRQVVDRAAGQIPVVSTGTLGGTIAEQADFVKRIYDTGVQAVIVISSQIAQADESDAVFIERMEELMHLTPGIPLGFYECPVPYKRLINADVLAKLLPSKRLIYHKDTCLDSAEVERRLAVAQGYNFGLYDAYMVNATSSLKAGASGLSCIQGNIYPELIVWICEHFNDNSAESQKVQQFFNDSMEIVHSAYPTIAKYSLMKRGFPISTYTRRKVEPLTDDLKTRMDELMVTIDNLHDELGVKPVYRHSPVLVS
ncbi:dihydrodipicolinate synthase family protein [Emticicia sp. BO119]|uniref:dihydrodipicolinate synthase family protein n=1 Tax=Emticicia sp. BO119 TaxID=2757768 RepID=UPI0015F10C3D|nr:dihydrodipicolinate synthase family protein [Emticicia sp. BO119]MBA4848903.1 dihydrodipicolinate synthase family protein [Emticicia sp. BO119]